MTSEIKISKHATVYSGPDATELFRAQVLASSIKMWIKCGIIPTRGVTISKMLHLVARYSGKSYPRGKAGAAKAVADLEIWINTMRVALPIVTED